MEACRRHPGVKKTDDAVEAGRSRGRASVFGGAYSVLVIAADVIVTASHSEAVTRRARL